MFYMDFFLHWFFFMSTETKMKVAEGLILQQTFYTPKVSCTSKGPFLPLSHVALEPIFLRPLALDV